MKGILSVKVGRVIALKEKKNFAVREMLFTFVASVQVSTLERDKLIHAFFLWSCMK